MTTTTALSTELADKHIVHLASKALTGEMNEGEARQQISFTLLSAGIALDVARYHPGIDQQTRDALADDLANIIERKALNEGDGGLDLRRIVAKGQSACGWARALARASVRYTLWSIYRKRENAEITVDPTAGLDNEDGQLGGAGAAYATAATPDTYHRELHENAVEDQKLADYEREFSESVAGLRSAARLHTQANALRKVFEIPAAIRPDDHIEREQIRGEIEENAKLAYLGARALYNLINTVESEAERKVPKRFLGLWDDYTSEELATLISKPAAVAHTLVLDALAPLPRPNRDKVAIILRTIRMADEPHEGVPGYQRTTRALLDSWMAIECAASSEFNSKGIKDDHEKEMKRMSDALAWPEIAAAATRRAGQPWGDTVEAVARFITTIYTAVTD